MWINYLLAMLLSATLLPMSLSATQAVCHSFCDLEGHNSKINCTLQEKRATLYRCDTFKDCLNGKATDVGDFVDGMWEPKDANSRVRAKVQDGHATIHIPAQLEGKYYFLGNGVAENTNMETPVQARNCSSVERAGATRPAGMSATQSAGIILPLLFAWLF